jgi:hypothetical protein
MARFDVSAAFDREADHLGAIARESEKAEQRAVGTLARRLPVEARRDIQAEYNLPAARITQGLSVTRGNGYVELRASKRGIGAINFGARQVGRRTGGVRVEILRGRPDTWPDAFIATGRGGNRQMFMRSTSKRLPIKTVYGPSVAQMLRKPGRAERLAVFAQDILRSEFQRLGVLR